MKLFFLVHKLMINSLVFVFLAVDVSALVDSKNEIPIEEKTIVRIGHVQNASSSQCQINGLIWNLQKGNGSLGQDQWEKDFLYLSKGHDLVLTQEMNLDDFMPNVVRSASDKSWDIAISFFQKQNEKEGTGVMTGAGVSPVSLEFSRTEKKEGKLFTPKISLISVYEYCQTKMMVINLHALNFVTKNDWKGQMIELFSVLDGWKGPAIFAGDFNTWSRGRTKELRALAVKHHFDFWIPTNDKRDLKLDHLLTRGLKINKLEVLNNFKSSDHLPLSFEAQF